MKSNVWAAICGAITSGKRCQLPAGHGGNHQPGGLR